MNVDDALWVYGFRIPITSKYNTDQDHQSAGLLDIPEMDTEKWITDLRSTPA